MFFPTKSYFLYCIYTISQRIQHKRAADNVNTKTSFAVVHIVQQAPQPRNAPTACESCRTHLGLSALCSSTGKPSKTTMPLCVCVCVCVCVCLEFFTGWLFIILRNNRTSQDRPGGSDSDHVVYGAVIIPNYQEKW